MLLGPVLLQSCSLCGGLKNLIGTSSFPMALQSSPGGLDHARSVCWSLCVEDSCVPAWHLAQYGFGTAGHKGWHPCCCALFTKLTNFKAGAAKVADLPVLEMLCLSCFLIKGRNSSPACWSLCGVSVLLWYPIQQKPIYS